MTNTSILKRRISRCYPLSAGLNTVSASGEANYWDTKAQLFFLFFFSRTANMQHVYITEREPAGGERLELRYVLKALDPDVEIWIYAVDTMLIIRINIIRIIIFEQWCKFRCKFRFFIKIYLSILFIYFICFYCFVFFLLVNLVNLWPGRMKYLLFVKMIN